MPPDLVLLSTLSGSNYFCLELIFMVPKGFESLKFDCIVQLWRISNKGYHFRRKPEYKYRKRTSTHRKIQTFIAYILNFNETMCNTNFQLVK